MAYTIIPSNAATSAASAATFVTLTPSTDLSAEFSLGTLTTGLVKNTVTGAVSVLTTAVSDTDFIPGNIVATTALGADAQTISITVAGNTDEGLVIVGSGLSTAGSMTLGLNDDATAPIYNGVYIASAATVSGVSTFIGASYTGPLNFVLEIDARVHDSSSRSGQCRGWVNNNSTSRDSWLISFAWAVTTGEITTVILKGSVATFFKSGYKVMTRRRKVT